MRERKQQPRKQVGSLGLGDDCIVNPVFDFHWILPRKVWTGEDGGWGGASWAAEMTRCLVPSSSQGN